LAQVSFESVSQFSKPRDRCGGGFRPKITAVRALQRMRRRVAAIGTKF